jgi:arginine decarboxylase
MLPTPRKFTICAGAAEGPTRLNAFDNALLAAGIGNLNLLRVSSVLPPGAEYAEKLDIAPGSLTPTAYGTITSSTPGERIAAAVGIGFTADTFGMIMEYSGVCTKEEAEREVGRMIEEAFKQRNLPLVKKMVKGADIVVEHIATAFAAVALWY